MHTSVVVLAVVAILAAAQHEFAVAARMPSPIVDHKEVRDDSNQYWLRFETRDGATHEDQGVLRPGPEGPVLYRSGSHKYTAPDGQVIELKYTADDQGYHPVASHLPQPPPPSPVVQPSPSISSVHSTK
ncbi:pupal cuticle protein 20-like [Frankliniella occidentalis]|uniref:Pupal cuticle protein 20-like n=1 Tax=Frankliniella occidentalis TaxID=133901 RepID=A0A6J1T9B3_FRAOC|nr:pupal cuticle protein 20-like [Frankliniella occidentalis]